MTTPPRPDLTPRELEVLSLLAQGKSSHAIGESLGITTRTAEAHAQRIVDKLGTQDTSQAVAIAVRDGIVKR